MDTCNRAATTIKTKSAMPWSGAKRAPRSTRRRLPMQNVTGIQIGGRYGRGSSGFVLRRIRLPRTVKKRNVYSVISLGGISAQSASRHFWLTEKRKEPSKAADEDIYTRHNTVERHSFPISPAVRMATIAGIFAFVDVSLTNLNL